MNLRPVARRLLGFALRAVLSTASCAGVAASAKTLDAPHTAQPPSQPTTAALGIPSAPLWLRYPAISPDGRQIAFAFQGNLFLVPAAGGEARLLVGNGHHSFHPVWSPDSRTIAYAADAHGNFDVFVVAAEGGPSRRLTWHSASELPLGFTPDGQEVLFAAQRMDAPANLMFPGRSVQELYKVSIEPGRRPGAAAVDAGNGRPVRPHRPAAALRRLEGLRKQLAQAPCLAGGA